MNNVIKRIYVYETYNPTFSLDENMKNFKTEVDSLVKYSEKTVLSGIMTSKGEDCIVLIGEVLDEPMIQNHVKQNDHTSYLKIYDDLTCARVNLEDDKVKEVPAGIIKFKQEGNKAPKELILTEQLSFYLYE